MAKLVTIVPLGGKLFLVEEVSHGKPGRPDHTLPGSPDQPDNSLPVIPGVPDNTLPTTPPPTVPPGQVLVIVRTADGKWHWASMPQPNVPTPLPEPTPEPK